MKTYLKQTIYNRESDAQYIERLERVIADANDRIESFIQEMDKCIFTRSTLPEFMEAYIKNLPKIQFGDNLK